jgi:hypothetical protein
VLAGVSVLERIGFHHTQLTTDAEDILRAAFARRDLLQIPVVVRPRSGPKSTTSVLMTKQELLGTSELVIKRDRDRFTSPSALGLKRTSERWWVARHGRWRPQHVEIETERA